MVARNDSNDGITDGHRAAGRKAANDGPERIGAILERWWDDRLTADAAADHRRCANQRFPRPHSPVFAPASNGR